MRHMETLLADRNEEAGNWDLGMPCLQEEGCRRCICAHVRFQTPFMVETPLARDSYCLDLSELPCLCCRADFTALRSQSGACDEALTF